MGQDPAAIREEIEQTRENMGDTVSALGYKANVPARAKESMGRKAGNVKTKIVGARAQVSGATPSAGDVGQGAKQAVGLAQENPLGLAIGALALGFLAGTLVPSTKIEDERLGSLADQVKEQALQTAQEAVEHGKQALQETAQTATEKAQEAVAEVKDKAQDTTQQHAQAVSESAKDSVDQVQKAASDSGETGGQRQ